MVIIQDQISAEADPRQTPDTPGPGNRTIEGRTPLQLAWARLRRDKVAMISLGVLVLLTLIAIFPGTVSRLFTDHRPNTPYFGGVDRHTSALHGPGGPFPLGADQSGRDVLARIVYGTRVSLIVGVGAAGFSLLVGVMVGMLAGYFGGKVDTFLSGIMDIFLSLPLVLTALSLVSIFGAEGTAVAPLWMIILIISIFSWVYIARIVRGQVLSIKEKEYIEAARSLGASDLRIMVTDVLPNLVAPVIVYTTLLIPTAIITEATLSFLGAGVDTTKTPTWGSMISESQNHYQTAWWYLIFPGVAILITVLAFNLFGDGLRDALDPRATRTMAK
jgi:peptide/nickel transport system permease protein